MRSLMLFLFFLPLTVAGQFSITGSIVNTEGVPLSGMQIRLNGDIRAESDYQGAFKITNVVSGTHQLDVLQTSFRYEITVSTDTSLAIITEWLYDLPSVNIIASRPQDSDPLVFNTYDKDYLETLDQGQDVPYILQFTPSTYVTSDAGTGIGYTGIRIRGSDPTRINVTINGVPLNDAESQTVYWVDLPDILSSTNDVVVQRGVGSSTNGAGAFGGSINLNTNKVYKDAYVRLDGTLGSFNTRKASINFGTGMLGNFTLDGRLSRILSDGFIDRGTADLASYYVSGAWLGDNSSLRFNVFSGSEITYQAWNGVPRDSLNTESGRTYNSAGAEKPGDPYDNEVDDYDQTHYQLFFNHRINSAWDVGITGHYTRGKGFFEQYKASEFLPNYGIDPYISPGMDTVTNRDLVRQLWLDNHYFGAIVNFTYEPDDRLSMTLSGAISKYDGDHYGRVVWVDGIFNLDTDRQYYFNDASKTDWNVFTKANYRLTDKLIGMLDLQVRGINYAFTGIDRDLNTLDQEIDHLFFNPKMGVTYLLPSNAQLYASVAVAHKEPNRSDYVERPADQRLKAERLIDYEAGYRSSGNSGWGYEVNAYYMDYKDQLLPTGQLNDVGAYVRDNIEKSHRLGLELAGAYQSDQLSAYANLSISQNRIESYTEFVDVYDAFFNYLGQEAIERSDVDIALSPELIAGAGLQVDLLQETIHTLSLRVDGKLVGEQFIDHSGDPDNALDAFHYADLALNYRLAMEDLPAIQVGFGVRNIYDSEYESNAWSYRYRYNGDLYVDNGFYPQAGRNYYLRLVVDF